MRNGLPFTSCITVHAVPILHPRLVLLSSNPTTWIVRCSYMSVKRHPAPKIIVSAPPSTILSKLCVARRIIRPMFSARCTVRIFFARLGLSPPLIALINAIAFSHSSGVNAVPSASVSVPSVPSVP